MIRRAESKDIDRILEIYNGIIDEEEKSGERFTGWKHGEYPTLATAKAGIEADTLFVMEGNENEIPATVILSKKQLPEYSKVDWNVDFREDEVIVIATVAVDVEYKKKGYGLKLINDIREYAKTIDIKALRLETSETNYPAWKLYEKAGFKYKDSIDVEVEGIEYKNLRCYQLLI